MQPPSPFPCVSDATNLRGLAALRRRFPRTWAKRMRRAGAAVGPEATVAALMRSGGMGRLMPRAAEATEARRLKKVRHCARRLIRAYGRERVGDITEAWLRRHRADAGQRMDVGRDVASAAFTLLRQAAFAAQQWGGQVRVRARLPPRRRTTMGPPPSRRVAPWSTVEALTGTAHLRVRAAVALQAHVGATPGRVLALRIGDIDLDGGVVHVRVPGRVQRQPVPFPLPPDAVRALRPWWRRLRHRGPDAPLFPQRGHSSRPTRSINRAIRREARRLGVARTTMAEIRRLAQAGLRGVGAQRAQVRGSARRPPRGRPLTTRELGRQRAAWTWQLGAEERQVPQRAPRRCHADEPERRKRRVPRRRRGPELGPTPLRRRSPWSAPAREADEDAWRGRATDASTPSGGRTPVTAPYFGPPQTSTPHVIVRQPQPSAPTGEALAAAAGLGLVAGGALGLIVPHLVEAALEYGSEVILEAARLAAEQADYDSR